MCFIVKKGSKMKIAKEDIECYKSMYVCDNNTSVMSILYNVNNKRECIRYNIGRIYNAKNLGTNRLIKKFIIIKDSGDIFIEFGFHSYIEHRRFARNIKCIIPKGTPYYINKNCGEYVSLKLKFVEILS